MEGTGNAGELSSRFPDGPLIKVESATAQSKNYRCRIKEAATHNLPKSLVS
jgi:hypothetical protein